MVNQLLPEAVTERFNALRELLKRVLELCEQCGDTHTAGILSQRLSQLQSAAMFVIVGEVKSGKSSMVNALLGEEICEVAPDPCTAVIQEIVYGEQSEKTLGRQWQRVCLPQPVLREITIVDTPGTNSVIKNHQTITEKYIPQSDLILFIFPAKNPHSGSAWDLLELICNEWQRKIVFILQQSDLATTEELKVNIERTYQYARQYSVQNPVVFALSAKLEQQGEQSSGFADLRNFIHKSVGDGEVWKLKISGARDTASKACRSLLQALKQEEAQLSSEHDFYFGLQEKTKARREKAITLRRMAVEGLSLAYERLSNRLEQEFANGLSVATLLQRAIPFVRDKDVRTWIKELQDRFEHDARNEIDFRSMQVAQDIENELKILFDELTYDIRLRSQNWQSGGLPHASSRPEILARLQQQLLELRVADLVDDQGIKSSDIGALTLAGGGIAVLGSVMAMTAQLLAVDITGGIITIFGVGMVAVTMIWKRSSILGEFSQQMQRSREEFRSRLEHEINALFERLFLEIEHRLATPSKELEKSQSRVEQLISQTQTLQQECDAFDLDNLKS